MDPPAPHKLLSVAACWHSFGWKKDLPYQPHLLTASAQASTTSWTRVRHESTCKKPLTLQTKKQKENKLLLPFPHQHSSLPVRVTQHLLSLLGLPPPPPLLLFPFLLPSSPLIVSPRLRPRRLVLAFPADKTFTSPCTLLSLTPTPTLPCPSYALERPRSFYAPPTPHIPEKSSITHPWRELIPHPFEQQKHPTP
eukprot:747253-Hanusia_phi.AAC.2